MSPNPSFLDYKLLLPVPASNFVALRRTETAIGIRCMSLILNGVFAITELDNIPLHIRHVSVPFAMYKERR